MARILIIDPDRAAARRHAAVLAHLGHEVLVDDGGPGLLALVAEVDPALVLTDVMLPGDDGFDQLAELRAVGRDDLPVIVLTGRGNDRDITRGFATGASDYLVKPAHLEVLVARVQAHLRLRDAQIRLQAANRELVRLAELKGRLVSVVSHELRTPLTSIRGALDLVGRFDADLPPRSRRLVAICLRNTDRLIRLVGSVLSFARLEAGGEMRTEEVDLTELAGRAREEIEVVSDGRTVSVSVEAQRPVLVSVDPDRIHQVLTNLLSNAVRHSPPGATVTVHILPEAGGVRVEVVDHGPGIAPEDVARLFLPFSQVGDQGAHAGGTGLGLAISREIVERLGGVIGVRTAPGAGSAFWFTLPGR